MAVNAKIIKRRLKSITSTKKITKAMELVAAAKMRKTVGAASGARAFAALAEELLGELLQTPNLGRHPLVAPREGKRTLLLLITPNRGLCGGLNANLFKTVWQLKDQMTDAVTVGKKGEPMVKKCGFNIIAAFGAVSDTPKWAELWPAVKLIREEYATDQYAKVLLVYSEFVSAWSQKPKAVQILPLSIDRVILSPAPDAAKDPGQAGTFKEKEVLFEPSPEAVLEALLPRLLETKIFRAGLEAAASEHSARMLAMRNAGEAAEEMINDLVFTFNQARQAGITREIAEVTGGAVAMSI